MPSWDDYQAAVDWLCHVADEPGKAMGDLFRESRGGVLLLHMTGSPSPRPGPQPGPSSPSGSGRWCGNTGRIPW
ncbi:MAG: hypothetical protein FWJ90_22405 [Actinomadura sp.]